MSRRRIRRWSERDEPITIRQPESCCWQSAMDSRWVWVRSGRSGPGGECRAHVRRAGLAKSTRGIRDPRSAA